MTLTAVLPGTGVVRTVSRASWNMAYIARCLDALSHKLRNLPNPAALVSLMKTAILDRWPDDQYSQPEIS